MATRNKSNTPAQPRQRRQQAPKGQAPEQEAPAPEAEAPTPEAPAPEPEVVEPTPEPPAEGEPTPEPEAEATPAAPEPEGKPEGGVHLVRLIDGTEIEVPVAFYPKDIKDRWSERLVAKGKPPLPGHVRGWYSDHKDPKVQEAAYAYRISKVSTTEAYTRLKLQSGAALWQAGEAWAKAIAGEGGMVRTTDIRKQAKAEAPPADPVPVSGEALADIAPPATVDA